MLSSVKQYSAVALVAACTASCVSTNCWATGEGVLIYLQDFAADDGGFVFADECGGPNLWHRTDLTVNCLGSPYGFGLYYGQDVTCDYQTGATTNGGTATSPVIDLTGASPPITLEFDYRLSVKSGCAVDVAQVLVSDDGFGTSTTLAAKVTTGRDDCTGPGEVDMLNGEGWLTATVDLSAFAGSMVELRLSFCSNSTNNAFPGWGVDNIEITSAAQQLALIGDDCQDDWDGDPMNGQQIAVELWMLNISGPTNEGVTGYTAFVEFDPELNYNCTLTDYANGAIGQPLITPCLALTGPGQLVFAANTCVLVFPPDCPAVQPPASGDALLVTIIFDVKDECETTVVGFSDAGISQLSFEGNERLPKLVDTAPMHLDDSPPVIICPQNITVVASPPDCEGILSPDQLPTAPVTIDGLAVVIEDPFRPEHGQFLQLESFVVSYSPLDYEYSLGRWVAPRMFTLSELSLLEADYKVPDGGCWGCGSPRYSVRLDLDMDGMFSDGDGAVWVYFGTPFSFIDCPMPPTDWFSTGDFVSDGTPRWDLSPAGFNVLVDFDDALLPVYGLADKQVLSITVFTDGGDGGCVEGTGQLLWFDNWHIGWGGDETLITFGNTPVVSDCSAVTVTCEREDMLALDAPYPPGDTSITCTAVDECGNESSCKYTVTVLDVTELIVKIQLAGYAPANLCGQTTRCIRFEQNCVHLGTVDVTFDAMGMGTTTFLLPCGDDPTGDKICAKDIQHTKKNTGMVMAVGDHFELMSTLVLLPGDDDNDGDVDINDVTWLVGTLGRNCMTHPIDFANMCPVAVPGPNRNADFNDDGGISGLDYSLMSGQYLTTSACVCASELAGPIDGLDERTSLKLDDVDPEIQDRVDLNGDGVFDAVDVQIFEVRNALPNTLSTRMLEAERARHSR